MRLEIHIADKMVPFATERRRHKIARGGRGSAKSQSIARILIGLANARHVRCLCARETQKSIKESTKKLLENAIEELGLGDNFEIQDQAIYGPHGSQFKFAGLRTQTAQSIKSYEDFNMAWVAEAQAVSHDSANILIPTIRKPGSEIWWDYNPDLATDFIHDFAERAIATNDPDVLVVDMSYTDNAWWPETLEKERQRVLRVSQDLHDHIYGGKLRSATGVMFKRNWFRYYDKLPPSLGPTYMAADYAGGPDPDNPEREPDWSEFGAARLDAEGNLYFIDWWGEQEDPDVWTAAGIDMAKRHNALMWYEEKGVILRATDKAIGQALMKAKCRTYRHALPSAGSKVERAMGFAVMCSYRRVYFPQPSAQPWVQRVVNQLCEFTGQEGKHDDAVDVCSLLARGLDLMAEPPQDAPKPKGPPKPFTREWLEQTENEMSEQEKAEFYR